MKKFNVEIQSITNKEGKEYKFVVVSVVVNNIPLEIGRFIYDDKIDSIFKLADSLTTK